MSKGETTSERKARKKTQLRRLWLRQNKRCHWCGRVMREPGTHNGAKDGKPPDDLCTLEHMHDRYSAERGRHAGTFVNVAACWRCNWERGRKTEAAVPLEVRRLRSMGARHRLRAPQFGIGK